MFVNFSDFGMGKFSNFGMKFKVELTLFYNGCFTNGFYTMEGINALLSNI